MKGTIYCLFLLGCNFLFGQTRENNFDKNLADSLGADDYGMKSYNLVILKTGKTIIEDKILRDSLFQGHMNNISKLVMEGKLIVAGPLGKNNLNYRGIFIFQKLPSDDLRKLLDQDPTIKAGVFEVEIIDWYGSAALSTYLPNHEKIQKNKF